MYQMVCPCSNESSQVRCVALPYDRKAVGEDDLRETRRLTVTLTSPRSRAKLTECGFESFGFPMVRTDDDDELKLRNYDGHEREKVG